MLWRYKNWFGQVFQGVEIIKDKFVYYILVVLIGFIIAYMFYNDNKSNNLLIEASSGQSTSINNGENQEENREVDNITQKAYISGQVKNPGVFEINENFRVIDLVDLAGGFTSSAYTDNINLSQHVEDADHIKVYSYEEMEYTEKIMEESKYININKATKEELMSLNGIGETISLAIIQYRDENGSFKDIEEIKNVNRIGESIFDNIKDEIVVK